MIENVRRTASVVAVEPCAIGSMFGTLLRLTQSSDIRVSSGVRRTGEPSRP
jgi:hypothetical protein